MEVIAGNRHPDNTLHSQAQAFGFEKRNPNYLFFLLDPDGETYFDIRTRDLDDGAETARLTAVSACPHCRAEDDHIGFRNLCLPDPFVLPVLTETRHASLPVASGPVRAWLPAGGRRLLAFSDSRSKAARLGPLLTRSHEIQMGRTLIDQTLGTAMPDEGVRRLRQRNIQRDLDDLQIPDLSPAEKAQLESDLRRHRKELEEIDLGITIDELTTRLQRSPGLSEFYCRSKAGSQTASEWTQATFERNRSDMAAWVSAVISREMAVPAWQKLSLTSAGLAEITYPGIDMHS